MNKKHAINFLALLIIGLAIYSTSFGNNFLWDDDWLVVNNIYIKSWKYLGKIFTTNLFAGCWGDSNFYRPMQSLTLLVDNSIWKLNPFGYHLTNTLIHIANSILIYWLMALLFKARAAAAILATLFFLVHPVQTEAVTYISGRADPLMTFFILLSFTLFIKWRNKSCPKRNIIYACSLSCFALALLSKEAALIFPFLILTYCFVYDNKEIFRAKSFYFIDFLVIAAVYLLIRVFIPSLSEATPTATHSIPLFTRLVISCRAFMHYLGFIIFPFNLHMERYFKIEGSLFEPDIWVSLILMAVFIILAIRLTKRSKMISFGLAWFMISLLPTSGIFHINAFIAEHWLYMPLVGLSLAVSGSIMWLSSRRHLKATYAIFIFILACLSLLSIRQNTVWKDREILYKYILKFNPQSSRVHFNLGSAYGEKNLDDMAAAEFKKAIELMPDYVDGYVNLGYSYQKNGKVEEAARIFKRAKEVAPKSYLPYYYLANLYQNTGKLPEAIELYKKALSIKPINPNIYFDIARAYDKTSAVDDAINAYKKTIKLDPSYIDAYVNLGALLAQQGRFEEAREIWQKGLKIKPDEPSIKRNLEKLDTLQDAKES